MKLLNDLIAWLNQGDTDEDIPGALLWAGGILLAVILRVSLWDFENYDTRDFLVPWYDSIVNNGRWSSFRLGFSNYTPPYLYLLTLASYLPVAKLHAIKLIAFLFDFPLAYYVMQLARLKYANRNVAWAAFMLTLFAPTVFVNSALWGQCDAMYATFLLASFYYLLQSRPGLAFGLLGAALSFKLQAVFFLPLFVFYYLREKQLSLFYFFLLPAAYLLAIVPAWLLGRPLRELLGIYAGQAGTYPALTQNAANFYQWLTPDAPVWARGGIVMTACLLYLLGVLVLRSRVKFTSEIWVKIALTVLLLIPFTLPKMHERYFFAADVFALVYAFYFPRFYYVPLLVIGCSLLSYAPFLYGKTPVALPYLAVVMGGVLVLVARDLVHTLFTRNAETQGALLHSPESAASCDVQ